MPETGNDSGVDTARRAEDQLWGMGVTEWAQLHVRRHSQDVYKIDEHLKLQV